MDKEDGKRKRGKEMKINDIKRTKKKNKSIMFTRRVYPETAKFLKKIDLDLLVKQPSKEIGGMK
jgi:hypothetical protein